jgi:hypothetical protein
MPSGGIEPPSLSTYHVLGKVEAATMAHDGFVYFIPLTWIWWGLHSDPNPARLDTEHAKLK